MAGQPKLNAVITDGTTIRETKKELTLDQFADLILSVHEEFGDDLHVVEENDFHQRRAKMQEAGAA